MQQHFYFLRYLLEALWIALTISTIGIIRMASPMAMAYSIGSTVVNSKALAIKGISQTAVVSTRDPAAAPKEPVNGTQLEDTVSLRSHVK